MLRWEVFLYNNPKEGMIKRDCSLLLASWISDIDALDWIRNLYQEERAEAIDDEYFPLIFILPASLLQSRLRQGFPGIGSIRSGSRIFQPLVALVNINAKLFDCLPSDKLSVLIWQNR